MARHPYRLSRAVLFMFTIVMGLFPFSNLVRAASTGIAIAQENVFVVPGSNRKTIHVVNNLKVKNNSGAQQALVLDIPKKATQVQITVGAQSVPVKRRTQAVRIPKLTGNSTANVIESYTIPLTNQQDVQFTLHTNVPVYTAHVYLPLGQHASLSAQGLMTHTQTMTVKGVEFRVFTRPSIPPGDDWTLSVQMLPTTSVNAQVMNLPVIGTRPDNFLNTLQAVANLLVAALVLVVGLLSIRATQWGRAAKAPVSKEEALLQSWENLELQYESGVLNEEDYQRRREHLKQRLIALKSGVSS